MKISTKGRYALRLMLDVAAHDQNGPVRIKDIANRQSISNKYLEQIVSHLQKAGYLQSIRGAQGGYLLSRPASEYTVGMILRVTEGDLMPVACLGSESGGCERKEHCAAMMVWSQINNAVSSVIDHTTLADLLELQTTLDKSKIPHCL